MRALRTLFSRRLSYVIIAYVWPRLALGMLDGLYFPTSKQWQSFSGIAFIGGVVVGVGRFGFQNVFTESISLVVILLILGIVFSGFATKLALGIAIGDTLGSLGSIFAKTLTGNEQGQFLSKFIITAATMALCYTLLFSLTTFIPHSARLIASNAKMPDRIRRLVKNSIVAETILTSIITVMFVWVWVHAEPLLIRPIFTWFGRAPSVQSIGQILKHQELLYFIAGLGPIIRLVLGASIPNISIPPAANVEGREAILIIVRRRARLPKYILIPILVFQMTFIFAGMITNVTVGLLVVTSFALFYSVLFYRPRRLPRLVTTFSRLPTVIRFGIWIVATYLSGKAISLFWSINSWSLLCQTMVSLVVFSVLFMDRGLLIRTAEIQSNEKNIALGGGPPSEAV